MHRILILSSAAIVLSGCSLNQTGSHFGYSHSSHAQSGAYGYNNCGSGNCAPNNSYSVADNNTYQHAGQYGAPQQPSAHAYGSQVQGHLAHGNQGYGYGQIPHLRGAYGSRAQRGYKYGTLGGVLYDTDVDMAGIQGRLGFQSSKYFGAEAEGSIGLISHKERLGTADLKSNIDYSLAAFVRGVVPVSQRLNIFSRAGYHVTGIDASLSNSTTTINDSGSFDGFAYGGGVEYALNPRDAIRFDYTRYDLGPVDAESLAMSYARKF